MAEPWKSFQVQAETDDQPPWMQYQAKKPIATSSASGTEPVARRPDIPSRTWGEAAKDTALGVLQGGASLIGSMADAQETASPTGMLRTGLGLARRVAPNAPLPAEIPETATLGMRLANRVTGNKVPVLSNAEWAERTSDKITSNLSPAMQKEKEVLSQAEGFVDPAKTVLTRPRLLGQFVAEQIPNLATLGGSSRVAGARAATGALERALARGLSREAAEAAAREASIKAGTAVISTANPLMEAGPAAQQAQQDAMKLPDEVWQQDERYKAMIARGVDPTVAKKTLAADAGAVARLIGAAAGYVGGRISAPFEAEVFTRNVPGGLRGLASAAGARRLASGAAKEAAEEAIQEGGSQFGSNVGVRGIDPNQSLMEGVPEAAGTGAALGAVLGGGLSVAGSATGQSNEAGGATPPPLPAAVPPPLPLPLPPLGLPAPDAITVNAQGEAETAEQAYQRQRADAEMAAGREELGLTPDVNRTHQQHPAAVENRNPGPLSAAGELIARRPQPLGLPAPGSVTVNPQGKVETATQAYQRQRADAEVASGREGAGLTPDVSRARQQHPASALNQAADAGAEATFVARRPQVQQPFPDAKPGSLADAVNVTAAARTTAAPTIEPEIAGSPAASAEAVVRSLESPAAEIAQIEPSQPSAESIQMAADSPNTMEGQPAAQAAADPSRRQWRKTDRRDARGRPIIEPMLDYSRDGLLEWLGASGGVDLNELASHSGVDPALLKDNAIMRPFGRIGWPALRRQGGSSLETLRERMQQDGWLPPDSPDAPPQVGVNEAAELIMEALNGRPVRHPSQGGEAQLDQLERHDREIEEARDNELARELGFADATALYDEIETTDQRQDGHGLTEIDVSELTSISEMIEQLEDNGFGLSDEEISRIIDNAGPESGQQAAALWRAIEERSNDVFNRTATGRGESGAESQPGQTTGAAEPAAGSHASGKQQSQLFSEPSAREQADGLSRARTQQRNAIGRDVPSMREGDGDLFAGPRPQQADIETQGVEEASPPVAATVESESDPVEEAPGVAPAVAAPVEVQADNNAGNELPSPREAQTQETAPTAESARLKTDDGVKPSPPSKKTTPKSAAVQEGSGKLKSERIEDFGEVLHGARKHYAAVYAAQFKTGEALGFAENSLSKAWPEPDYQKLLEDGTNPRAVAFLHSLRDEVPTKPKAAWKLKKYVELAESLRDAASGVLSGEITTEHIDQVLSRVNSRVGEGISGRMDLYEALGHDRSLKGIRLAQHKFNVYKGVDYGREGRLMWTVDGSTKAKSWPTVFADGDTKEQAIERFGQLSSADNGAVEKKKRQPQFAIYSEHGKKGYSIGKKVGQDYIQLERFDDLKKAREYLSNNINALEKKLSQLRYEPSMRRERNSPRIGEDHRSGADVTPDQFSETFGFRGVQFGNYVEGGRRQEDLNESYDALMDLAGVLDVPPRALSLSGSLGLAFGARGQGGKRAAKAHFEPDTVVINLTKKSGAGSLAHEWWHALDNYFSRMAGRGAGYATEDNAQYAKAGAPVRQEMATAFAGIVQQINSSQMRVRSRDLDRKRPRTKAYWSTGREMSARAFEQYVITKLEDQGAANDYLANIVSDESWMDDFLEIAMDQSKDAAPPYPYLLDPEIKDIRAAYDHFFNTLESEETKDGSVRLFSQLGTDVSGLEFDQALRLKNRLTADWGENAPSVVVVESAEDFPASVKADANYQRAEGVYEGRPTVWINIGNIASEQRFAQVLAHEAIGHFGVEQVVGAKDWEQIVSSIDRLHRDGAGSAAMQLVLTEVSRRYGDANRDTFARETIAVMAEKGIRNSLMNRVVAAVRQFLRKIMPSLRWSESEVRDILSQADSFLRSGRTAAERREAVQAYSFARPDAPAQLRPDADEADAYRAQFDKIIDSQRTVVPPLAIGRTPMVLRELGAQDIPISISRDVIRKASNGVKHDVPRGALRQLPEELADPLAVFRSRTEKGSMVAVTELRDGSDRPVIVAVDLRARGNQYQVNRISSVYGKDGAQPFSQWGGDLAYQSERAANSPVLKGVQFPNRITGEGDPNGQNVLHEQDIVNRGQAEDQTQTSAFRRWFGDSKVVGADGKPLVVYHGTQNAFTKFDGSRIKSEEAFFFTDDSQVAKTYSDPDEDGSGNVVPVFLRLTKPYRTTAKQWANSEGLTLSEMQQQSHDGFIIEDQDGATTYAVFSPNQIKSATGNNGEFDPSNSDIRFSLPEGMKDDLTPSRIDRALNAIDKKLMKRPEFPESWDPAQREAAAKFATYAPPESLPDRFHRIRTRAAERATQLIFDQFRPLRRLSERAYMQAHLSKATDGALEAMFDYGLPGLKNGALTIKQRNDGLRGELGKLGSVEEVNQFLLWMAGNRADQLLAEGRELLFNKQDVSAMKRFSDGKLPDGRQRMKAYRETQQAVNKFNRAVLDIGQQAGVINEESRQVWESEFYIPFYREMEDGPDVGPGQTGLLRQRVIERLAGGNDILGDPLENMLANWSQIMTASMRNMAANAALDQAVLAGIAKPLEAPNKKSVWTMREGQQKHWEVEDKFVMDALEALNFSGYNNPAMKAAARFKHALTFGVTINPSFRIRNLARDVLSAMATTEVGYNPIRNLVTGWTATRKGSDTQIELMAGGGAVRFGSLNDGDQAANAKRLISMGIQDNQILDTQDKVKNAFRRFYDWWQEVGDRGETINRAAIYERALQEGRDHLQASFEARDLLNFTSMGSSAAIRALTQVLPFFNARLQGLDKLYRGAKVNPRRFSAVTGMVAMASALLYLLNRDDEDYKALPDHVRDTYWVVKLGGKWLYLPKPFEVGALGTIVERGTELALAGDDYKAKDFANTLLGVLSENLAMNPVPQIARPITEVAFNYDMFRSSPIDSMAQQRLLPADRYTASTAAPAVALGKATGISPQRLEHLVRGYFGWLGIQALSVTDMMTRGAMQLPSNPRADYTQSNNLFVLGDFVKEPGSTSSKYVTRFYESQRKIDEIYASARQAERAGDSGRAQRLLRDPRLRVRPVFQRADRQITDINQEIRRVTADRSLDATEKNQQLLRLRAQRDQIARQVDEYERSNRGR
ncbi:MAG: LPD5 domain-containing protein [Xanthomonadaceae bacterium]|jgi:hypothetical protein|nr:LPD5 domain-containing protein [Xanthomonadaceae bacterium]